MCGWIIYTAMYTPPALYTNKANDAAGIVYSLIGLLNNILTNQYINVVFS